MNDASTQPIRPIDKEGLRKVILSQYFFHEVKHHPPAGEGGTRKTTVVPRAHGMADIYKCLHQGTFGYGPAMGVKHIPNREFFLGHLTNEYFKALPNPDEPVLEFVAPDDSILRVNIRPFRAQFRGREREGFDVLADLVLDSSEIEKGSLNQFQAALVSFVQLNNKGDLNIEGASYVIRPVEVNGFLSQANQFIKSKGELPVMGHSEEYHRLNQPSYVVADLAVLKKSALAFLLKESKNQLLH